jgi:creatinine amidohydrolase/Fe(II)-dependent formamide hydrolase-like protein
MQLKLSTWCDVKEYLTKRKDIIIPIGSTEQHGPMGYIGTDFICPETIAKEIGDRTGALVAPTLPVGMSQHHLSFPGRECLRDGLTNTAASPCDENHLIFESHIFPLSKVADSFTSVLSRH